MKTDEIRHPVEEYRLTFTRSYIDKQGQRVRIGQPLTWCCVLDLGIRYSQDEILAMLLQKCQQEMTVKMHEED